ncbi:hypothetical protein ACHAXR_004436 [Thalassiosira sp. AJA248-18]
MAIKTRAKRQWTERRYRRRLRQTQLGMRSPQSWNDELGVQQPPLSQRGQSHRAEDEFVYELTTEHRQAFLAAHAALNGRFANEYGRNRHAIRKREQFGYEYEGDNLDYDLELEQHDNNNGEAGGGGGGGGQQGQEGEIRADLTKSSLAIRGGLIRMPIDNVRLVCDAHLQPGILSIETRDVSGGMMGYENYGNANRYGNIHGSGMVRTAPLHHQQQQLPLDQNNERNEKKHNGAQWKESEQQPWRRNELAYSLTVDEHIYRRVVQEIGDSYRTPCGMYYCCHGETGDGDHVGIGVAIVLLLVVFFLLVLGMIVWPTW